MSKTGWLFSCILVITLVKVGFSQQRMEEIISRQSQPMYFDELNWANGDTTTHFTFLFKISHDYLSFVNREPTGKSQVYHAEMNLILEVYYSDSTIKRFSQTFSSDHSELAETRNRFNFLTGELTWSDSKKPARYVVDITDLGNNKPVFKSPRKIGIKNKAVAWFESSWFGTVKNNSITLANLGKNIPFGSDCSLYLALRDTTGVHSSVFRLLCKPIDKEDFEAMPDSVKISAGLPLHLNYKSSKVTFPVQVIPVQLPLNNLEAGHYAVTITSAGKTDTVSFMVYWLNMPYSLYDLDLATRTLKYLASEAVYDVLNSGSARKRIESFRKFWKEKDPTPLTSYNELMAEYYRRVDFSFASFPTSREPGWRTDRGKIYILNGEPDSKKRLTPPNMPPQEIWIYGKLKKTFVFADTNGKGEFKLVTSK